MSQPNWTVNLNLPNGLTLLRLFLVPSLLHFLVTRSYGAALWIFGVAGVTDALDGWVAKRFGLVTRLGAVLDPAADKALVVTSVVTLAALGDLPGWLAGVIVVRDVVIVAGAWAYWRIVGSFDVAPSVLGKANTGAQIVMILLVLVQGTGVEGMSVWLQPLFLLVLGTTVCSGVHYVVVWGARAVQSGKLG